MKPVDYNVQAKSSQELIDSFIEQNDSSWYIKPLMEVARECSTVVELGVFQGQSIAAFMAAGVKNIRGYDTDTSLYAHGLFDDIAEKEGVDLQVINQSSLMFRDFVGQVDLVFLDTRHVYEHVYKELSCNSNGVNKYIVIHDTNYPPPEKAKAPFTSYPHKKVKDAVLEWMNTTNTVPGIKYNWVIHSEISEHSGMIILKKVLVDDKVT